MYISSIQYIKFYQKYVQNFIPFTRELLTHTIVCVVEIKIFTMISNKTKNF
jgi:hypothetical protein